LQEENVGIIDLNYVFQLIHNMDKRGGTYEKDKRSMGLQGAFNN